MVGACGGRPNYLKEVRNQMSFSPEGGNFPMLPSLQKQENWKAAS